MLSIRLPTMSLTATILPFLSIKEYLTQLVCVHNDQKTNGLVFNSNNRTEGKQKFETCA